MADEPVVAKKYRVTIPGQGTSGAQVFEADTPEELSKIFETAQTNATQKIRELADENAQLKQAAEAADNELSTQVAEGALKEGLVADQSFNREYYFKLLYEDPLAAQEYALKYVIGSPVKEFIGDYQRVRQGALVGLHNSINAAFVRNHPELLQVPQEHDIANSKVITDMIQARGWEYSVDNLEAAYALAKAQGKLKLGEEKTEGTVVATPQAATVIVTSSGQTAGTAETEENFLATAPLDKVREYLEKKYAGQGT